MEETTFTGDNAATAYSDFLFLNIEDPDVARLDITTAYFNFEGWANMFSRYENANELPVRLLLGSVPVQTNFDNERQENEHDHMLDGQALLRKPTSEPGNIRDLLKFIEWLRKKKVEVRLLDKNNPYNTRFLHAKTWLLSQENEPQRAIVGSANLTRAGLRYNREAATFINSKTALVQQAQWFEQVWKTATDFKDEILKIYSANFELENFSTVYYRMLMDLFNENPNALSEDQFFDSLWLDGLKPHQVTAAKRVLKLLQDSDGALLSDEVGLGKTWIAGALAKYMEFHGYPTAIITPASVKPTWMDYKNKQQIAANIYSYQNIQTTYKNDPNLTQLNWLKFIIIDEAHYLRNTNKTHEAIKTLVEVTGAKVLMLTATPVNNTVLDLKNIFSIFIEDFEMAGFGIASLQTLFIGARRELTAEITPAATPNVDKIKSLLHLLAVKRTRSFVRKNYQDASLRFPKEVIPHKVAYSHSQAIEELVNRFDIEISEGLNLTAYKPSKYLKSGSTSLKSSTKVAEINNEALIRMSLLKQLESSLSAFSFMAGNLVKFMQQCRNLYVSANMSHNFTTLHHAAEQRDQKIAEDINENFSEQDDDPNSVGSMFTIDKRSYQDVDFRELKPEYLDDLDMDIEILQRWSDDANKLIEEETKINVLAQTIVHIAETASERSSLASISDRQKILIFTSSKSTAQVLLNRLPSIIPPNLSVEKIDGHVKAADRIKILHRFAPKTQIGANTNLEIVDPIQVLITTDVLAEGVNLQQAQNIIHYDLPWNPMKALQRIGRLDRINSEHDVVHNYYLYPETTAGKLLRLSERLQQKIKEADETIGTSAALKRMSENTNPLEDKKIYNDDRDQDEADEDTILDLTSISNIRYQEGLADEEKFIRPDLIVDEDEMENELRLLLDKLSTTDREEIYKKPLPVGSIHTESTTDPDAAEEYIFCVKNSTAHSNQLHYVQIIGSKVNLLEPKDAKERLYRLSGTAELSSLETEKAIIDASTQSCISAAAEKVLTTSRNNWLEVAHNNIAIQQKTTSGKTVREKLAKSLREIFASVELPIVDLREQTYLMDLLTIRQPKDVTKRLNAYNEELVTASDPAKTVKELIRYFKRIEARKATSKYRELYTNDKIQLNDLQIVSWFLLKPEVHASAEFEQATQTLSQLQVMREKMAPHEREQFERLLREFGLPQPAQPVAFVTAGEEKKEKVAVNETGLNFPILVSPPEVEPLVANDAEEKIHTMVQAVKQAQKKTKTVFHRIIDQADSSSVPAETNVVAYWGMTTVYGTRLNDGRIALTRIENMPEKCDSSAQPHTRKNHAQLIMHAVRNDQGLYNWERASKPGEPAIMLSAALGREAAEKEWQTYKAPKLRPQVAKKEPAFISNLEEKGYLSSTELYGKPKADRKVFTRLGTKKVWGEQLASGEIVLKRVDNFDRDPQTSDLVARTRHTYLIKNGRRNGNKNYNWRGRSVADSPLNWEKAIFGDNQDIRWQVTTADSSAFYKSEEFPEADFKTITRDKYAVISQPMWQHPVEGRKLYARHGRTEVWAEQTADGQVVLTRAVGIPPKVKDYARDSIRRDHAKLLQESSGKNADGTYNWEGRSPVGPPTKWAGGASGKGVDNVWEIVPESKR